ncbi:MAG: aromatic amino acid lyase, partial [Bacteroidota bacterium]
MPIKVFKYGEDHLTASKALAIAQGELRAEISTISRSKIDTSAQTVGAIAEGDAAVYGINTGFGPLCTTTISASETSKLQENLLKSHAVGLGQPVEELVARLMLVLKVHALAKGYSGIRFTVLERMLWHLENNIIPIVPSQGSVGASGDLAPLAHLFLPIIGLGSVSHNGE